MTDDEERIDKERRNHLMTLALKQAKTGKKFISGSKLRERRNAFNKHKESTSPRPKKFMIKEVPKLEDIKDIDAEAEWSGRDWLYEIALISLVDKVIDIMKNIGAQNELVETLVNLLNAMKDGDPEDTKEKLHILTEGWGATTSTTDRRNYHLLRAVIRIIYSTYPLE